MVDQVNAKIAHHRVFHTGESPPPAENLLIPPEEKLAPLNFYPPPPLPTKQQFSSYNPIKTTFLAVGIAPAPLVLISYSLDTKTMLVLILIDIQYSQKAVSSFEKGSNCQNHSSSGSLYLVEKFPPVKFLILPIPLGRIYLPPPLTTIWKILHQWKKLFFNSKKPYS